jgi:hypothetical protein
MYEASRRSWHGLGELVLAGPQFRRSGTIRLRLIEHGFATVAEPALRITAGDDLDGRTYREIAERFGVDVGAPEGVYHDGSGVEPDEHIAVPDAAALGDAFDRAGAGLHAFAPGQTPVLWPEHFDVAITLDEVNYGVSLGDGYLPEPYAYVGPWQPRTGDFWNAPFGAAKPLAEVDVADFFRSGLRHLSA